MTALVRASRSLKWSISSLFFIKGGGSSSYHGNKGGSAATSHGKEGNSGFHGNSHGGSNFHYGGRSGSNPGWGSGAKGRVKGRMGLKLPAEGRVSRIYFYSTGANISFATSLSIPPLKIPATQTFRIFPKCGHGIQFLPCFPKLTNSYMNCWNSSCIVE